MPSAKDDPIATFQRAWEKYLWKRFVNRSGSIPSSSLGIAANKAASLARLYKKLGWL